MEKYIMALDQGTTSSRCILFDRGGNIRSMAQKEFNQIYPELGWVEHNPVEIWSSQLAVAVEAMANIDAGAENIAGIGITNQRETTIVWDRDTGKTVYNAIVWQCRRTADMIEKLKADGMEDAVRKKTGLVPDAYFSATKIAWILDNVEGARKRAEQGRLMFGTVDTWLIWNLSKGKIHVTDYTNASRTMLFNISSLCWDRELLGYFNIPESMLPEVKPSSYIYGMTDRKVFGGEIPISGAAGDQQSSLFGQCCFNNGEVKNTYGTGCFLLMNTGKDFIESHNGLITTLTAQTVEGNPVYALEGSVFVAGAGIQWLRDGLKMIENAPQSEEYAETVEDTNGVYVVPAFTGMGAPYWNPYARGIVTGITRGCEKAHFVRAVLEAVAYQANDVIRAMEEDSGLKIKCLKVDGGACSNGFLMQFQSDITDTTVLKPKSIETTALGAAYLSGLAIGYWKSSEELAVNFKMDREFNPLMEDDRRKMLLNGWQKAVRRALLEA